VDLSQVALSFGSQRADAKAVIRALGVLLEILNKDAQSLDNALGDYVFFPLSHIFRQSRLLPERALELALNCLDVLLLNSWNQNMSNELAKQLLILLTFIAGGRPAGVGDVETSEEVKVAAFRCLTSLFKSMANSKSKTWPADMANLPPLGHAVAVVLDAVADSNSFELQFSALAALEAFQSRVDRETLVGVFPGVVSKLTKCLQPTTSARRSYRVLERGLQALSASLKYVMADSQLKLSSHETKATSSQSKNEEPQLDDPWLRANAPQVKLALGNVVKLRNHEKPVVRHALLQLCLVVLEDCCQSLSTAVGMMVETLIVLSNDNGFEGQAALKRLALTDHNIVDLIQSSMHTWAVALPRLMHSNDDGARRNVITQLSTSFRLLSELGERSEIVEDSLATNLRDSILTGLQAHPKGILLQETREQSEVTVDQWLLAKRPIASMKFQPLLLNHRSQDGTLRDLEFLLQQLGGSGSSLAIAREMLDHIRDASGGDLLASFWLSLKLLQSASHESVFMEDVIFTEPSNTSVRAQLIEELYSFALTLLSGSSDSDLMDWRLYGLALEAVALEAEQLGREFRLELVDALYPMVHLTGSSNELLRSHAFTSLDITTRACGYNSVSDLLVGNVDYLVNAVSLKLNTFDISPQAPKVLLMMIKLTGPPLLPFLEDLVSSIFAALDSFHGYPQLVALLFSVLEGIVEESSRDVAVAIESGHGVNHGKTYAQPQTIQQVCRLLEDSKKRRSEPLVSVEDRTPMEAPKEPWKSGDSKENIEAESSLAQPEDTEEKQPKLSKVYQMVQKIARLGQHYLTHESPTFRRQLLSLLTTACNALYVNENEFLPLINDIWPTVIKRLYDDQHFVAIAAAEAVSQICRCAGDFMSSRIQTEWRDIKNLYRNIHRKVQMETRRSGRGVFTPSHQVQNALVKLLMVIVEYVRIDDDMFDDMLDLFDDMLDSRKDIQDALSLVNADAVWLNMWTKNTHGAAQSPPQVAGFVFETIVA
jgi:TELO2-interacting protein 1